MFYRVLNTLLCPSIRHNETKITQPAIICAKQTTKTLEEGVKTCSNITKTPEQHQWRHCGVFIVNFEHIFSPCYSVSNVNFEQIDAGREAGGWLQFTKSFSTDSSIEQAFGN